MKTYTNVLSTLRTVAGIGTNDTAKDAVLMGFYNDSIRTIANIRGGRWPYMFSVKTITSVSGQSAYKIPGRVRKITDVYMTSGTEVKIPTNVEDPAEWTRILAQNIADSDTLMYYRVVGNEIQFKPAPATTGLTITISARKKIVDITAADYTTGTIVSITSGAYAVVGSGTTWTSAMAGRFIKMPDSYWYEIASVDSTTTLTLATAYEGSTLSSGSASYTIGEVPIIPEAYDMAPIYRAMALYTTISDPTRPQRAQTWWRLYDGGNEAGLSREIGGILGQMLENEMQSVEQTYTPPSRVDRAPDQNTPPQNITGL